MTKYFADGRPADFCGRALRYDAGGRAHVVDPQEENCERFLQALIDADSEPTENLEAAEAILDPLLKASQADVARQMAEARQKIKDLRLALDLIVTIASIPMDGVDPLPIIIAQAGDALVRTGRTP